MTAGGFCRLLAFALAGIVWATVSASASAAGPPRELEELMAGMAQTRGVVSRFRESKQLALLEKPLQSEGLLYFVPPDRMVRLTVSPLRTALVVDGERMAFHEAGTREPVDLSDEPTARGFVQNFTVLFGGDLEQLRQRYEIAFEVEGDGWTMTLRPRSSRVRSVIASVELRGDGRSLRQLTTIEPDGDRSVTVIEPVHLDRPFTDAELARLFGPDPLALIDAPVALDAP